MSVTLGESRVLPSVSDRPQAGGHAAAHVRPDRRERTLVLVLILAATFVDLWTLKSGHGWGDDFAQYILHAEAILARRDYIDTGYVYNPDYADVGPRGYPPGLPLLLTPLIAVFGVSLTPMKVLMVGAYAAFLGILWRRLRRRLSRDLALLGLLYFAVHPWLWDFKDAIASEFPFLVFFFGALERHEAPPGSGRPFRRLDTSGALITGCLAAAAALTRTIGIVFFPAIILGDLLRFRRLRRATVVTAVSGIGTFAIVSALFPGSRTYLDQLEWNPLDLLHRTEHYGRSLARFFLPEGPLTLAAIVSSAILGLSAVAIIRRLRARPGAGEWAFLGLLCVTLLWPSRQGTRFLLPLFPFIVGGALERSAFLSRRFAPSVAAGLILCAIVGYPATMRARAADDFDTPDWRALVTYVRAGTPADAVFLFKKPRLFALATDRPTGALRARGPLDLNLRFIARSGARYLVHRKSDPPDPDLSHGPILFENASFVLRHL